MRIERCPDAPFKIHIAKIGIAKMYGLRYAHIYMDDDGLFAKK